MANIQTKKAKTTDTYPDLYNENLPPYVLCAKPENLESAILAFQRFCAKQYRIVKVYNHQSSGTPPCMWIVDFQIKNENDNDPEIQKFPSGSELTTVFEVITRFHPLDVKILTQGLRTPDTATITYGVDGCDCKPFFDWGAIAQSPLMWQQEETTIQSFELFGNKA